MLKKIMLVLLAGHFLVGTLTAQNDVDTTAFAGLAGAVGVDTLPPGWRVTGVFTLNLTQVSLTNWAAGGRSSIGGISMLNVQANWQRDRRAWDNTLVLAFGGQQADGGPAVKTEDRIELVSKYGYRLRHPWYLAGLAQFRTQFTEGFNEEGRRISHFMAPGYLLGGLGIDYRPGDHFSVFLSPAMGRLVVVQDRSLWLDPDDPEERAYGVLRGNTTEFEFGAFLRMQFNTQLAENITFLTRGDLFSNYLRNPGNIKVNWETLLSFSVNEWFAATLNTLLIYDHDIQLPRTDAEGNITTAPATQFKQTLGVGLTLQL
jgi:hypothetical protein